MVEAIACFFLISFPLAAWLAYSLAKRMYRPQPGDNSFLAKILSSNGQSFPPLESSGSELKAQDRKS